MRVLIQRVKEANVSIDSKIKGKINYGLLVFIGIENEDNAQDVDWLVKKVIQLRIFNDQNGIMNLSVKEVHGEVLIISQFTLHASTKKGNRPSYIRAAKPDLAITLYEQFVKKCEAESLSIKTGEFGADMDIHLINDGPVTIFIDSKNRE